MRVSSIHFTVWALLLQSVLALGGTGCHDFLEIDWCIIKSRRVGDTVSDTGIRIHQGTVVAIKASPVETDGDYMDSDTPVRFATGDPAVLGVAPLDYESEACGGPEDAGWYFVFYGVEPGQTELTVRVDGKVRLRIPAEVLPP